jgi:methylthioribose-1-phosphate isomerase
MTDGAPPPELAAAMRSAVNDNQAPTPADLLEAAERLLDKMLLTDCESRTSALNLLTVDALMTRAIEESAKDPALLEKFPELAMKRISSRAAY